MHDHVKVPSRGKFSMMAHACDKIRSVKVEITLLRVCRLWTDFNRLDSKAYFTFNLPFLYNKQKNNG